MDQQDSTVSIPDQWIFVFFSPEIAVREDEL